MNTIKSLFFAGLVGCTAALTACTAKPTSYTINGAIEGLEDSTVVTLVPVSHEKEDAIGEAVVMNGKFQFTGETTDTMIVALIVKDCYGRCEFILDNSDIAINGKVEKSKGWDGTDQYDWDATVTGSTLTDQYKQLMQVREDLNKIYEAKNEKYGPVWDKFHAIKDKAAAEAFKQTEEYKAAEAAENNFFKTVEEKMDSLVSANKETFWGPLLATSNMSYFTPEQADLYNKFSDAAKNSFYGRKMKAEIWPVAMIGEPVKPFTVKGDDGKDVTLAQLLEGKKYVLIDFWASWCNPCRKEIPNVKQQYALYKDKGFDVISISIDKDEAAWKKALAEEKLEWPNFRSQEVADLYKVKAVPTMYLIDGEGKIVADGDNARGAALAQKLEELLK